MSKIGEFSEEQCQRIDEVEQAAYDFLAVLTEKDDLDDGPYLLEIADYAAEAMARRGFRVRFPFVTEDTEGHLCIKDYW